MADSFNYIAFGNTDLVTGDVNRLEMNRGRMFEYTPAEVAKGLERLDDEAIAFLEALPTFLCSEIIRSENGPSMFVRFGRISETAAGRREIGTTFETLVDFGEVAFPDVDQALDLFGADRFQLYRTHWAVRTGNVGEMVTRLAALAPAAAAAAGIALEGAAPFAEGAAPPVQRKNLTDEADSVEAFLRILGDLPLQEGIETFYRGHEDAAFELTPSLLRKFKDGGWQFLPAEDRLTKELLIAHYDEFAGDHYCFDRLVRGQHYGLPTRLLDITDNPLVALYFACASEPRLMDVTGEVIVFRIVEDSIKYYDSDRVSCIANLSNLSYGQKNKIDLSRDVAAFNDSDIAKKLLHHIKAEKSYFEPRIEPEHLGSVYCVKAKRNNSRIKSQSGAFLLFGHEATLPEFGVDGIEIVRVPITNKRHILDQLSAININATTVYPSIDRTALHLRSRYLQPDSSV